MSRMNIILNALLAFMVYTTGFLIANRFSEIGEVSFQSYQNNLFIPISKINLFSIILNNLIVIINLILGGFVFGVPTLLNIFSNGYMFGEFFQPNCFVLLLRKVRLSSCERFFWSSYLTKSLNLRK